MAVGSRAPTPGPQAFIPARFCRLALASALPRAGAGGRRQLPASSTVPVKSGGSWRRGSAQAEAEETEGAEQSPGQRAWGDPASLPQADWTLRVAAAAPWPGRSLGAGLGWALPPESRAHGPLPCPQPGRPAQPGHRPAGAAAEAEEEAGVLHVLQPLWSVQPRPALPLHPRPREGGRVHQVPLPAGPGGGGRGRGCPAAASRSSLPVCRFVRGTCKKTDGTCPFSHHVSKEKVSMGPRGFPLAAPPPPHLPRASGRPTAGCHPRPTPQAPCGQGQHRL